VAAFPLPPLDLYVPLPLRDLFVQCEQICITACCGLGAFDVTPALVTEWLKQSDLATTAIALEQFERLLEGISRHRGTVRSDWHDGCFNHTWQSPHDGLTYFAEWRRVIAEAVARFPTANFFSPAWLTESVVGLRDAILAERAFDRLPILADALEEAGCDNRLILDHLRGNEPHAHHCWAVDVLCVGGGRAV
jgi:hypothetical protein